MSRLAAATASVVGVGEVVMLSSVWRQGLGHRLSGVGILVVVGAVVGVLVVRLFHRYSGAIVWRG